MQERHAEIYFENNHSIIRIERKRVNERWTIVEARFFKSHLKILHKDVGSEAVDK